MCAVQPGVLLGMTYLFTFLLRTLAWTDVGISDMATANARSPASSGEAAKAQQQLLVEARVEQERANEEREKAKVTQRARATAAPATVPAIMPDV